MWTTGISLNETADGIRGAIRGVTLSCPAGCEGGVDGGLMFTAREATAFSPVSSPSWFGHAGLVKEQEKGSGPEA